jgi:predicted aspartyl protease
MISGTVNPNLQAIIPLSVRDTSGREQRFDAIVDTGFHGSLTLPMILIHAFGLVWRSRGSAIVADGTVQGCDIYDAVVIWDGQPRNILVESAEADPLVGMGLMHHYELNLQAVDGGSVTLNRI